MKKISRGQLKKIFKKAKHFRLPKDLENRDFSKLKFLGWVDQTSNVAYTVLEYKGKLEGVRWKITRLSHRSLGVSFCEVCKKRRRRDEIMLISAPTRKLPKGVNYRTRGNYVCFDLNRCATEAKDIETLETLYWYIA